MDVVPAGVHDGDIASRVVFGTDFAGVGQAGLFLNRKRVELGAKHHGRAGAVLEDGNNSSSADMFGNVIAQAAEAAREVCRSLSFMGQAPDSDADRGRRRANRDRQIRLPSV